MGNSASGVSGEDLEPADNPAVSETSAEPIAPIIIVKRSVYDRNIPLLTQNGKVILEQDGKLWR